MKKFKDYPKKYGTYQSSNSIPSKRTIDIPMNRSQMFI